MASEVKRRRLLFLLPFAPRLDAAHGGGQVVAHLLRDLVRRHDVALIYFRASDEPPLDPDLQRNCSLLVEVPRRLPPATGLARWLRRAAVWSYFLRGRPEWVSNWSSRRYGQTVREVAATWKPDIVQIEYHLMGQYLPALSGCPAARVLTEHELGIVAADEQRRNRRGWSRFRAELELRAWQRFEPAVLRNVQAIVAFTEEDCRALAHLAGHTPVSAISPTSGMLQAPLNPIGAWPPQLLFVGNYAHPPNVDAALRLIDAIYPAVRAQHPEAGLLIVGKDPPPALLARQQKGVVITGYVEDVRPFLDRAALVVAPLRQGGGIRVKVLESLAAGKALVASPLAVAGFQLTSGEHVVLAESDVEFQATIVRLLDDPQARAAMASRSYAWARQRFSREHPAQMYERLYESLLRWRAVEKYA